MPSVNHVSDQLTDFVNTQIERVPDVFQAPGYAFILLGIIGALYLVFGLKIYKFVLALIMLSVAGGVAFFATDGDWLVSGIVALAAGLIAFLLQYVFVLLIAGLVFASIVFVGLWAWLERADIPLLAACAGIGLGIFLAVKLFKFIIIFTTAAIGAACVTGTFWVLYQTGDVAGTVQFDPAFFEGYELTTGLIFGGLVLFGILVQAIILAFSKGKAKAKEEE